MSRDEGIYKIMGEYRHKIEVLDEVEGTKKEAEHQARDYRISFGEDWRIWVEEEDEE